MDYTKVLHKHHRSKYLKVKNIITGVRKNTCWLVLAFNGFLAKKFEI